MLFSTTGLSRSIVPRRDRRSGVGWLPEAGARMRTHWLAKMLGTIAGMGVFFAAYFWLLHHPLHPVTIMPLTALDRVIGFRPAALPVYLSLWFYVSLAPALLIERRELVAYLLAVVGLGVAGLGVFLVWPTAVPIAWRGGWGFRTINPSPRMHLVEHLRFVAPEAKTY